MMMLYVVITWEAGKLQVPDELPCKIP